MTTLIAVVGPTASGKTAFAARLAYELSGEVISADSRQVYRGMTIGTGKDLEDYVVEGVPIRYHLIDILPAGERYNLFRYKQDFENVYRDVAQRVPYVVLCGGTGLYVESVLKNYALWDVPCNPTLREELETRTLVELTEMLKGYGPLHNTTDTTSKKRVIRAIEIAKYTMEHAAEELQPQGVDIARKLVVGLEISREDRRRRITERLDERLKNGMVEEVRGLLDGGITAEDLMYYGLEYKFVTRYVIGQLSYDEMRTQLETAIHQFAKRQMTWFRGMEQRGLPIFWLPYDMAQEEKVARVREKLAEI